MKNDQVYNSPTIFSTYLRKSTEKAQFIKSFKNRISSGPDSKINTLLDIGCHDGELTLWHLNEISNHCSKTASIEVLDPSLDALDRFKKRNLPTQFQFNFHGKRIENFEFDQSNKKFDFIVASHCLYWSEDLTSVLLQICNSAKRAVVILRENVGIYEVQKQFSHLLGNKDEQLYTAENIEAILKAHNVAFEREKIQTTIEIPTYKSQAYEDLISFFLQTKINSISDNERIDVDNFLQARNGVLKHNVSFFWLDMDKN